VGLQFDMSLIQDLQSVIFENRIAVPERVFPSKRDSKPASSSTDRNTGAAPIA
jgi:hypothetical protein